MLMIGGTNKSNVGDTRTNKGPDTPSLSKKLKKG